MLAAAALLALSGALALPATAQAQETTNFYLWSTTITVGENSGDLGYDNSDSFNGSISTSADFGYPPWNPPHKHHVDRESYYTVEAIKSAEASGARQFSVYIDDLDEINDGPGNVTLWLNHTAYPFSVWATVYSSGRNAT